MNKKTLFVMPMAIVAMGLASCNNGAWPTKTLDEAHEIAQKMLTEVEKIADNAEKFDQFISSSTKRTYNQTGKSYEENITTYKDEYDLSNLYNKEYNKEEVKSNEGYGNNEHSKYYIFKDNKEYDLSTSDYTGVVTVGGTAENFKNSYRGYAQDYYKNTLTHYVKVALTDLKDYVDFVKSGLEAQKTEYSAESLELTFTYYSKDEKSLKVGYTGVLTNCKEDNDVFTITSKEEFVIEDYLIKNISQYSQKKGTQKIEDKEVSFEETEDKSITIEFKQPANDSINLDDYVIEKA